MSTQTAQRATEGNLGGTSEGSVGISGVPHTSHLRLQSSHGIAAMGVHAASPRGLWVLGLEVLRPLSFQAPRLLPGDIADDLREDRSASVPL